MAVLNVNPTRMELTRLKKKLATARRGHKLLKDKRDELMRRFLELIRENQAVRKEVEAAIGAANQSMALAKSVTQSEITDVSLMLPKQEMNLSISKKNVMSVEIPEYAVTYKTTEYSDIFSYGFAYTSGEMDGAILSLSEVLPKMLRLAEVEKSCQLMASEIEKTRRRVNALEYVMIPGYEETIRYITMKLDENERSTITRLMKVKDMMVKEAIEEKRARDSASAE